jgi:putative addiction module component (TIGR02574 family)
MSAILKKLGIDTMSVDERLDLIGAIWETLSVNPEAIPVPEHHLAELERRIAAFEADGDPGRPADEVIADIKRRL